MPTVLTEDRDGEQHHVDPEPTGKDMAIARVDDQINQIKNQKMCDTSKIIDFLLDLRNDLMVL